MCRKLFLLITLILMLALASTAQAAPWGVGTIPTGWTKVTEYKFDDGSGQTIADSSGNNWDMRLGDTTGADTNDPTWGTDGLTFDGVDDYAAGSLQGSSHPASGVTGLMIDVTVTPASVAGWQGIIDAGDNGGMDRYQLFLKTSQVRFAVAGYPVDTAVGTAVANTTMRITAVWYDATHGQGSGEAYYEVYVNGTLVRSWETGGAFPAKSLTAGGPGSNYAHTLSKTYGGNVAVDYPFEGLMDLGTLTISEIPEPATVALLGLGGLALIRKRKRS